MVNTGLIPVSLRNLSFFPTDAQIDFAGLVAEYSEGADLVILGFTPERLAARGIELFEKHPSLSDVLFVSSQRELSME